MLFKNCSLLLGRDIGLTPGPRSIRKQLRDFMFKDVRLLSALDIDQSLPVVTPPSPPRPDGIMLKPDLLFDRFIVVAVKGQQNDPTTLRQGNLGRFGFGELQQNSVLFFGHNDLGCLPWHGDTFGEDGQNEQSPLNRLFKQDQLVLAALVHQPTAAIHISTNDYDIRCFLRSRR